MKKRETIYICDHCGKVGMEVEKLWNGNLTTIFPEGWTKLGKEHLCPKCSKIYRKFKEETDDE